MHFVVLIGGGVFVALIGCLAAFFTCSDKRSANESFEEASKQDHLMEKIATFCQMICMPVLAPLYLLDKHLPQLDNSMKGWGGEHQMSPEDQSYVNHTRQMEREHGKDYWKMLQGNKFDYRLHKENVQDDVREELDAV